MKGGLLARVSSSTLQFVVIIIIKNIFLSNFLRLFCSEMESIVYSLIIVGGIPMLGFFFFGIYGLLSLLRSKWIDDFNKWFEEPIPGKLGCKNRCDIILDSYTKILFIGRGIMILGAILGYIFL